MGILKIPILSQFNRAAHHRIMQSLQVFHIVSVLELSLIKWLVYPSSFRWDQLMNYVNKDEGR